MTITRWHQPPVTTSLLVFAVLITVAFTAFTASNGRPRIGGGGGGGRGGDVAGGVEPRRLRTTILPSLQSTAFNGNHPRQVHEEWRIRGIQDFVLNATGRKNVSVAQSGQTKGTQDETKGEDGIRSRSRGQGTTTPHGTNLIKATIVKNQWKSRGKEKIKFTPDEISRERNDVLVLFALQNYTDDMEIDEAELIVLLRCRQLPINRSAVSARKPDVRRITIFVYNDTGNATSSGNMSSVERSSMTASQFQIRRTKWVKVLLMRGWIEEALRSPTRTLRLRLVYDKSGSIEVVTTDRKRMNRVQGKVNRRRLRTGQVGGDRSRRPKELSGNRKRKMSPVLVVMKREKLLS